MEINENLIQKLEHLANLKLTDTERAVIRQDLEKILDMVNKIEEFDTENVEPLRYMNEDVHLLREDKDVESISKEQAFRNAPQSKDGYFQVPKVIDIKK